MLLREGISATGLKIFVPKGWESKYTISSKKKKKSSTQPTTISGKSKFKENLIQISTIASVICF